jgi:hypothetical protein
LDLATRSISPTLSPLPIMAVSSRSIVSTSNIGDRPR